ncbi:MAG: hypothetical protein K2P14_01815 [Anaeroplasmataceae bacterium]|nr:hypothetical protein [Anaeroplasmataceae bacterium]
MSQRVLPEGRADLKWRWFPALKMDYYYDKFEFMCRSHSSTGNNRLYISRTPDKIIDADDLHFPFDIPNFDTEEYGRLDGYLER